MKEVDLDLPLESLICFVGRCGSGSRTMAVDVLYAESRRRYMLALSPVEREGLGGVGRVEAERITGLPPAIYFDCLGDSTRGTVASFLQVDRLLGQLLHELGEIRCPECGGGCRAFTPEEGVVEAIKELGGKRSLILAPLILKDEAAVPSVLRELRQAGYLRVRVGEEIRRLDEEGLCAAEIAQEKRVEVVVDRLVPESKNEIRLIEGVRNARAIARGFSWLVDVEGGRRLLLNQQLTCGECGAVFDDLSPDDILASAGQRHSLALEVYLQDKNIADIEKFSLDEACEFIGKLEAGGEACRAICRPLEEARMLGAGYLRLESRLNQLSTGERQRLLLAGCLSSGLVGILYIFEGSGGSVHPAEQEILVGGLRRLVGQGNTVLVLDHAQSLLAAADEVWTFVQGEVEKGFHFEEKLAKKRPPSGVGAVRISSEGGAFLKPFDLEFPLQSLVCVTGVSGAGKSLLLQQVLVPALRGKMGKGMQVEFHRHRGIHRIVEIGGKRKGSEKTLLGELGLFEQISRLYADVPAARKRGYPPEWFRLDSPGGRCTTCEGRGTLHYDLQFMEDISLTCPTCEGNRFRAEILDITLRGLSMSDLLNMNIDRAFQHFGRDRRLPAKLAAALDCGLGDRLLGESGGRLERGEWLRLQLAGELVRASEKDIVVLDMPAGGGHPEDVAQLVKVLEGVVARGASVLVADHHPALLAAADWIVELGPGAGPRGGRIVFSGKREDRAGE